MSATFFTVESNTSPAIEMALKRRGVAIDLTDATAVELTIKNQNTKMVTNTGHKACSIIDVTGGVVSYNVEATDFGTGNSQFTGEVKITWNSGRTERLYNKLKISSRPKDD